MTRSLTARVAVTCVVCTSLLFVAAGAGSASTGPSIVGVYDVSDAALVPLTLYGTTLQVATDATYPPDESMHGTTMVGLDPDIMRAIATTLGMKYRENDVPFDNIIVGLKSGRYQVGSSSFPDTKALESSANFVDYYRGGEAFFAASSSTASFKGLSSLCGQIVGVVRRTVEQSDAEGEVAKCPTNAVLTVVNFSTDAELHQAVIAGNVAGGFVDSQEAGYLVASSYGTLRLIGHAIDVAPFGLATAKTSAGMELALALRAALKTLIANGTYEAILAKWGASGGALPSRLIVLNGATF